MTTARDVALWMLCEHGPLSVRKLHYLLFYAQQLSLVWNGRPLFDEPIYAAAHGPVVRSVSVEWWRHVRVSMLRARRRVKALKRRCLRWTREQIQRRGGRERIRGLALPGGWSERDAACQFWGLAHGGMLR